MNRKKTHEQIKPPPVQPTYRQRDTTDTPALSERVNRVSEARHNRTCGQGAPEDDQMMLTEQKERS